MTSFVMNKSSHIMLRKQKGKNNFITQFAHGFHYLWGSILLQDL